MFAAVRAKLVHSGTDLVSVRSVKSSLVADISIRYQSTYVSLLLSKASFLNPCFKTLAYLSDIEKEETVNSVIQNLLANISVEPVSDRGDNEIVEDEEVAFTECCTSPKSRKPHFYKIYLEESLWMNIFIDHTTAIMIQITYIVMYICPR